MSLSEPFFEDSVDPIDIVEDIAAFHEWDFDRIADDQIAMAVAAQWRTYSLTLAWSGFDETLRLICSFELEVPQEKHSDFAQLLNLINEECWGGAFTFWPEEKLALYRYGLILSGNQTASPQQINKMIASAVANAERFYPAMQLLIWGDKTPKEAMQVAICEAYGCA